MASELPVHAETSLGRGLRVLAALADHGPMRVDALAACTGLPTSTVYRYVRQLVAFGFLEARDGAYVPGIRVKQMTRGNDDADQLIQLGAPMLAALTEQSGETSMLAVRAGRSALILDRVESLQAIRLSFARGSLRPLYAGATSKVLLAYAPPTIVEGVLGSEYPSLTANTPAKPALRRQLSEIRAMGYAITHGEADLHAVGIAVPVFRGRACLCGLSIAGPEQRFGPERITELLTLLRGTAAQFSEMLIAIANLDVTGQQIYRPPSMAPRTA